MNTKKFGVKIKAAGTDDGLDEGQVSAVISVFGTEDSAGDVVMPGAFTEDLERWAGKGDNIPFIWAHDWSDPFSHIGSIIKAAETDVGLEVVAQLEDLDTNPKAAQVYRLLKGRRVTQFSFAYDIQEAGWGKRGDREVYELRKLAIFEGGPCLVGVNQETELLAVKASDLAARLKAGDMIDLGQLTAAHTAIGAVIEATKTSAPSGADMTDEPSQADGPSANDEDPSGDKSSQAAQSVPRRALAVARITQLS